MAQHSAITILCLCGWAVWAGCAGGPETRVIDDKEIEAKIVQAYIKDDMLCSIRHSIEVRVEDGKVVLAGRLGTPEAVQRAYELAQTVKGVKAVENRIVCRN